MTETNAPAALPFPNSYIVEGANLLAGEYPFHLDREEGVVRLRALLDAGITTFIDLTEDGESGLAPYDHALREEAAAHGATVAYHRLAIRDVDVPTRELMQRILATLRAARAAGRRAYVHCWGGAGRTGVVVGCVLREQGLDADAALAEVARLFATMPKSRLPKHAAGSPQTAAQRRFVREWSSA